jgi:hypothetical protein
VLIFSDGAQRRHGRDCILMRALDALHAVLYGSSLENNSGACYDENSGILSRRAEHTHLATSILRGSDAQRLHHLY